MSGLAATRQALATAAVCASAPYALVSGRIKLAYTKYVPSDELLKQMLADGPYLVILEGEKVEDIGGEQQSPSPKRFRVLSRLYVGFDRHADNDFIAIENFVEALCDAWRAETGLNVVDTNFPKPEIDTDRNPCIAMYEIQAECLGC